MIQFIISCLEFFLFFLYQIRAIFDAVNEQRGEVRVVKTPAKKLHQYKHQDLKMMKRSKRYKQQQQQQKEVKLPNEILNLIFTHINKNDLTSCVRVSKQWHSVVTPILWKAATPTRRIISCIPAFARMEIQMNTKHFHQSSHYSPFFNLKRYGQFIQSLDLSKIAEKVTDCTIKYIAASCPKLSTINLSRCQHITDDSLLLLSSKCTEIKRLSLSNCRQISERALQHFDQLESLDIGGCHGISEKGIIVALISNKNTLRHLTLRDVHVTTSVTVSIARVCGPRLESLNLARTKLITDHDINYIVTACPNLTRIDFSQKYKKVAAFDQFMHAVNRHRDLGTFPPEVVQQHDSLMSRYVSDRTIASIVHHCRNLKQLQLENWQTLDDVSLKPFVIARNLNILNLRGCKAITQEGLLSLKKRTSKRLLTILHNYNAVEHCDTISSSSSSSSSCN